MYVTQWFDVFLEAPVRPGLYEYQYSGQPFRSFLAEFVNGQWYLRDPVWPCWWGDPIKRQEGDVWRGTTE